MPPGALDQSLPPAGIPLTRNCHYRYQRCVMKHPTVVAALHKKLGAPPTEALESLRLLKAFRKLAPRRRFEVVELVERLATELATVPDRPLS
jgi:hypothetical protein